MPILKSQVARQVLPRVAPEVAQDRKPPRKTEITAHVIAAAPIVATNLTAVGFQLQWGLAALGMGWAGAVLYSLMAETVALSVSYHAYKADIANLRSGLYHLAAIMLGAAIGFVNASHHLHTPPVAVIAGMASFLSPLLWRMHSRQIAAEILAKNGLLDQHSIRLGTDRWIFHPVRSFTVKSQTAWSGERNLSRAILNYDRGVSSKVTEKAARKAVVTLEKELS